MGVVRKGKLPMTNLTMLDEIMYESMSKIGMIGVETAVDMHGFKNRTFNLQDSYGYAVYNNGQMVGSPMMAQRKALSPKEFGGIEYSGREEGENLLEGFQAPTQGWTVVVVAGMVYASFVEEVYGLDVLLSSEQEAKLSVDKIFKSIKWELILGS